jgi:hypothetical protein
MLSPSQVEAAEQLLCNGMPKIRVVRTLGLSRTSIEKIAAGKHLLQHDAAGFLARYSQRQTTLSVQQVCPHTHSLQTVERIEELLCYWWRDRFSLSMSGRRLTLKAIERETGISGRVIENVMRGRHPAQIERDGKHQVRPAVLRTREEIETAQRLLNEGLPDKAVRSDLGMTGRTLRRIKRGVHYQQLSPVGQQIRTSHMRPLPKLKSYLPSRRAIERICAAIQRSWTSAERLERMGVSEWTVPEYAAS